MFEGLRVCFTQTLAPQTDWIRDSMEWWGIRIQWDGSLMGGEILRSGWGVVMSW